MSDHRYRTFSLAVTCPKCGALPHKQCRKTRNDDEFFACSRARGEAMSKAFDTGEGLCQCERCTAPEHVSDRDKEIYRLLMSGKSKIEVADIFGVSAQRIRQIWRERYLAAKQLPELRAFLEKAA